MQVNVNQGDFEAARHCLREMAGRGLQPSGVMYSQLLGMCIRLPPLEARAAVTETWAEMTARGVEPTLSCWNARIRVELQGEPEWRELLGTALQTMAAAGLQPQADTFNSVMAAAMAATEPLVAVRMFNALVEAGIFPDKVSYSTLMSAFGYLQQLDTAESVFERLRAGSDNDVIASNALIAILADAGRMDDARRVMRDLVPVCRANRRVQVCSLSPYLLLCV